MMVNGMPGLEQIDPRKIWKNYVLALVLIFALVSVSHFAEIFVGGDSHAMASDINTSGRQGTLSQRILYFATSYQHENYQSAELRQGLEEAMILFENSHVALSKAATDPDLRAMYFADTEAQSLDRDVWRFLKDARTILDGDPAERDRAVSDMQSFGPNVLLQKLDAAVHLYEDIAQDNARRIEFASMIGYALALLALVFEAVFIFRPSHQTIVEAFAQLEGTKSDLEDRERDAFMALEEAEEAWAEAEAARVTTEHSHGEATARLANAGDELAAPMAALKAALEEASMAQSDSTRAEAMRTALAFADVSDRMSAHLMAAEMSEESEQERHTEVCNLASVFKMAVGTVSAFSPEKSPILLSLPKQKTPPVRCDSLALFRIVVHLLRDAQDLGSSNAIRLAVSANVTGKTAQIDMVLTQTQDGETAGNRIGARICDKKLSDNDVRASVLGELVEALNGKASLSVQDQRRTVVLSFAVDLQAERRGSNTRPSRRAS